jgi:cytochrome P450/diketogulonate reductase-like aldo/keto reductase
MRPETLRAQCDESLRRLETDRVELLYLHAPDPYTPLAESAGELRRLMGEGKTRSIGVSNFSLAQLKEFHAVCPISAFQPPYNMLQREIEQDTLPWCLAHGVSVCVYWPLLKGLLAGKLPRDFVFQKGDGRAKYPMFQGAEWQRNQDLLDELRPIANELGKTVAQLVINWTIHQPGITAALCGAKRPEQIQTAGAMGWQLTAEQMARINAALFRRGTPVTARLAVTLTSTAIRSLLVPASQIALPPGPRSPAWWQLVRYSLWPLGFLERSQRRFGEAFTTRMAGYGKLVILSSPEAVKDVFRGDPHVLHSGEGNEFLNVSVGKTSVLVLDDEPHARQRRVLLPPLKGERMRAFFTAMRQATLDVVGKWPIGKQFPLDESMRQITCRVIFQAVFGWQAGPTLETVAGHVHRMLAPTRSRWSLVLMKVFSPERFKPTKRTPFYRDLWELDASIYEAIRTARELPPAERPECALTDLRATHDDGSPLPDTSVRRDRHPAHRGTRDDSSRPGLGLLEIVAREDVTSKIRDELQRVCGDGLPNAEQMPQLEYLDATIREVLRLRTIIPFVVRKTKAPFTAGGREYPEGVLLTPCSHLVHRRPDLYPEPEKFRPERFLERKFAPHEWFPFGGGNRTCLGMAFICTR